MVSLVFGAMLVATNGVIAVGLGLLVQALASQWGLGPLPRAGVGLPAGVVLSFLVAFDLGLLRFMPLLVAVYYLGIFQVGCRLGKRLGLTAPSENDPPDGFLDVVGRFQ